MSKSKHNYSQYSNKNANKPVEAVVEPEIMDGVEALAEPVVVAEPVVEAVAEPVVEPVVEAPVEKKPEPTLTPGVVTGCMKLNVRANPQSVADIVCVIDAKSEVKIDMTKSNDDWFRVNTAAGVDGYCMKKFINVNL